MALNFSTLVYSPCQAVFGRQVNFTSKLGNSFTGTGRGIYDSREVHLTLEDGSIIEDQDTILDIRDVEFSSMPIQGDTLDIPYDPDSGLSAIGQFEIVNVWNNGGGETTLQIRKIVP